MGSTPGSGRSPGGGHGNPLQCSCLENPTEEAGGLWSTGSQRLGHNMHTQLINNDVLLSGAQQGDSVIHTSDLLQIPFPIMLL